jgi:acetolactate synthase I/II/III large subunit
MVKMKVADYVLTYLKEHNVTTIFGVYGAAIGDLIDALSRVDIKYIAVMHEQAGSFAAETYAKVSGNVGCCLATSGPGGQNLLTGVANCYYDSVPCIFITGQINTKFLKCSPELRQVGFQENDIVSMARPITKFAEMVKRPDSIRWILDQAFYLAQEGRKGPVLIDIPMDIQKADIDPLGLPHLGLTDLIGEENNKLPHRFIKGFIEDFKKAKRPVLLAGGGVRPKAVQAIRMLGMALNIPCLPTWNAIDVFSSDYENYRGRVGTYGGAGRNFAIQNSDLLLAIGTRIPGRITGGNIKSFARDAKKYLVDIDHALLKPSNQDVKFDVNIECDAESFCFELNNVLLEEKLPNRDWWMQITKDWRDKYDPVLFEYKNTKDFVHPYWFMRVLSEILEPGDIIVSDCGGNAVVTYQAFQPKFGQRVISSNGNSPMGYSFAGAMGAACLPYGTSLAIGYEPYKRVICIIGDGGFNMNIQELRTIKNYGINRLKTFILNNHSYGIGLQYQETNFDSRFIGTGPDGYNPPDFIPIVKAYGIATETIKNHDELKEKIIKVINSPEAIVCDVDCGMFAKYEPRIFGWKTPIEDMYPYLPRDEFRNNLLIDPIDGWESPELPKVK